MNILYIASSSDWHVDLWPKYFTDSHTVYLFSDKEYTLQRQPFVNVNVFEETGYIDKLLNFLNFRSHKFFQVNKLISVKKYARKVDKIIEHNNIDIVHSHSLYYGYLTSFIKSEIPVVFTPMGSDIIIHAQTNYIHKYMAKRAYNRADIITGDSVFLQNQGYKVGARKEHNYIIQNGIDSSIFYPKSNNLKEKYTDNNNQILLFSPRAIHPLYNIDIIIESVGYLKDNGYSVKCMFSYVFGDEYLEELKEKISNLKLEDNIIWLGRLNYHEMARHYNAADIVISIPSSDSSPKSVYEAMFCGKPIVITDLEWSHELLSDCNCLARIKVRDPNDLTSKLEKIINEPDYSKMLSRNSINNGHKYFDYEKSMKKMESIMLTTISDTIML